MIFSISNLRRAMRFLEVRLNKLIANRLKDIESSEEELKRVYEKMGKAHNDIQFAEQLISKLK
jgi:uncharacterized coiled-coil protein SlyX